MKKCLFCKNDGPYNTIEHTIPQSLGNDDSILEGEVCDKCQAYLGQKVESYVLGKTPLAFWRTFLGVFTKKGKNPSVELSQPEKNKGIFEDKHTLHDNNVGFTYHDDCSISVDISDEEIVKNILKNEKGSFQFVYTPKVLQYFGRFLCKVGLELICVNSPTKARLEKYDKSRQYARFGNQRYLWPIFHYNNDRELNDLKEAGVDDEGYYQKVVCYNYSIAEFEKYILFAFEMGLDVWVISLNDPFPTPRIKKAIPSKNLNVLWYQRF